MPRDWKPQEPLMEWLCTPGDDLMGEGRGLRKFKTLTALAAHLGVHRQTLYDWQEIPGFDEALAVVARRTFRKYRPGYIKTLIAQLHKPNSTGYDRLVTAWVRYIEPAMDNPDTLANEEAVLPHLISNTESKGLLEARASEKLRQLPTADREIILRFHHELSQEQSDEVVVEATTKRVGRMISEAEEREDMAYQAMNDYGAIEGQVLHSENLPTTTRQTNLLYSGNSPKLNISTNKWKPKRKK